MISGCVSKTQSSNQGTETSKSTVKSAIPNNPKNDSLRDSAQDTFGNTKLLLMNSGSMQPYTTVKIKNSYFDIVMSLSDTIYISTTDTTFQTIEGYKVGTLYSELNEEIKQKIVKESGWAYFAKLNSGWSIAFCIGNSCTDQNPSDSSRVSWIFKRK